MRKSGTDGDVDDLHAQVVAGLVEGGMDGGGGDDLGRAVDEALR